MRILSFAVILTLFAAPAVHAYPEYPPFERTGFSDDYGMFRWWESCWWRVADPYVYLLCGDGDTIRIVYPDGTVTDATSSEIDRFFSLAGGSQSFNAPPVPRQYVRFSGQRLTPAPGDGYRLTDVYGGRFWRFDDDSNFSSSGFSFDGSSDLGTGVFQFDRSGNLISSGTAGGSFSFGGSSDGNGGGSGFPFAGSDDGTQRIFGQDVPTSDDGGDTGIFDRDGNRFEGTRMHDIFYEPIGLFACENIHDSIEGGIFGPIPCTSYRGVFGPTPEYGRAN